METKDARDSPYSREQKKVLCETSSVRVFVGQGHQRRRVKRRSGQKRKRLTLNTNGTDSLILLSLEPSQFLIDKWGYVFVRCSGNTGLHGLKCFILNKTDLIIKEKSIIHFEQRSSTGVFQGLQKN